MVWAETLYISTDILRKIYMNAFSLLPNNISKEYLLDGISHWLRVHWCVLGEITLQELTFAQTLVSIKSCWPIVDLDKCQLCIFEHVNKVGFGCCTVETPHPQNCHSPFQLF